MTADRILKSEPDWFGAAQALVEGLQGQPSLDRRVDVLERICTDLGDALYPGFAKLLAAVAHFGEPEVKALVADTLAQALLTARLPAARVPAWGAGGFSSLGMGGPLLSNSRKVGPLEFLCVWLVRDIADAPLDAEAFETAATYLLDLVSASPKAASLYIDKLRADAADPTEGLHNAQSRRLIEILADRWAAGDPPAEVARAVARAAQADRGRFGLPMR
ncbi:hypothetical protein DMC25_12430 [Caulobacter sp. D4A]|uniref:hypothetical protein n=1 Tax=unclassified Caulobacter TaxID=2648921 RepID=UPI000D736F0B|nr:MULTISPECIES: hypothetical protein [unclassified Caulobacter]PXA84942.1 hypothetical protein DMC18_23420 [Caulobacter sp. D5]PXA87640.1 hypothetical protein DMC25_12430 [Caulobacter sp. D4A]